jgi:glycerophosphoryl diester phosphodiesterase
MTHRSFPEALPVVVAHRGASSAHPENTLASFEAAIALGAPFVEFDVRRSSDDVPVVIHDPTTDRTAGVPGIVRATSADALRRLDVGRPGDPQTIPLLDEVLACLTGRAGAVIEIKNLPGEPDHTPDTEPIVDAVLAALDRTAFVGPVLVVSFNPASVAAVRSSAAEVGTGLLLAGRGDPRPGLALAARSGHDMVLPGTWGLLPAGPAFVTEAHAAGVRVGTWTVDDAPTVAELAGWGVDAIASNDPGMALAALAG